MLKSGTTKGIRHPHEERLREILEDLHTRYHRPEFLKSDPLLMAHRFEEPSDREVVALIAASFAFGNVKAILNTLDTVLKPLLPHPAEAIAAREPREWSRLYRGFVYRWVRAEDLRVYMAWLGGALRTHGNLGSMWQALDSDRNDTVLPTLARWVNALTEMPTDSLRRRKRVLQRASGISSPLPSGAHLLLTSPEGKSSCKRMLLFLRWVCRPADGIDLGLWKVDTMRLLMPVDTHIMQISKVLNLTERRTADLRTALEITDSLRAIQPDDPTRYDFALTRPGILKEKVLMGTRI